MMYDIIVPIIGMQEIGERDLWGKVQSEERFNINLSGIKSGDYMSSEKEITGISGRSRMVIRKALNGQYYFKEGRRVLSDFICCL